MPCACTNTARIRHSACLLLTLFLLPAAPALPLTGGGSCAQAAQSRFPRPQFESGYKPPSTQKPARRDPAEPWVALALLAAGMATAVVLALRRRSRRGLQLLSLACLLYFGFQRQGCVCVVGSIQNLALGWAGIGYRLPLVLLLTFLLPLIFALLYGRVFCSAVCPFGALQELLLLRPLRFPAWLDRVLGFFAVIYLGLAVLLAATGTAFIICRYDPFVTLFRLDGSFGMLIFSAGILVCATVVARPYCRWVCPYGVLLAWCSRFSQKHLTITPGECVQCRLCEDACPIGAIEPAGDGLQDLPGGRDAARARLLHVLVAPPLLALALGIGCANLAPLLARLHPTVDLADHVRAQTSAAPAHASLQLKAFRASRVSPVLLFARARAVVVRLRRGGWWLGVFLGLALGCRLALLCIHPLRAGYEPDRARCVSCGRCFASCPQDHLWRKQGPV